MDRRLTISIAMSVLMHGAVAVAFWASPSGRADAGALPEWRPTDQIRPPEIEKRIELGRDDGRRAEVAWIGFTEPTPHKAPEGQIDQAQQDLAASVASPAADSAASTAVALAEQQPQEDDTPQQEPGVEAGDRPPIGETDDPMTTTVATPRIDAAVPVFEADRVAEALASAASRVEDALRALAVGAARTPERREVAESAPAPTERPAETPADAASTPTREAVPSDREASAAAKTRSLKWELGKPLTAEGLELRTVRPEFDPLTRLSGIAQNPVVVIGFGRDGKAWDARLSRASGNTSVDRAIRLMALRWTAKGRALAELPAGNPATDATARLNVEIEILLR